MATENLKFKVTADTRQAERKMDRTKSSFTKTAKAIGAVTAALATAKVPLKH